MMKDVRENWDNRHVSADGETTVYRKGDTIMIEGTGRGTIFPAEQGGIKAFNDLVRANP